MQKLFGFLGLTTVRYFQVRKFIVIFYLVGLIGFLFPITSALFEKLVPFALLLNFVILLAYHTEKFSRNTLVTFLIIFLIGLVVEIIGVQTGKVFGAYTYGNALGIKIYGVPVLIGVNWLFLSYASLSTIEKWIGKPWYQVVLASLIMVIYDVVLEQVAPSLDFWYWTASMNAPFQNYLAWFFLALIFTTFLKLSKIPMKNLMAATLLGVQFFFFFVLFMVKNVVA